MANVEWVRAALVGTLIETSGGVQAVVDDIDNTHVSLQVEGLGRALHVPLREIREAVVLWARLRQIPNDAQLREAGIPAAHTAYLVPLIGALRSDPGVREWLQGARARSGQETRR